MNDKRATNKALEQMVNAHIESVPVDEAEGLSVPSPTGRRSKTENGKAGAIARLEAARMKAMRKVPVVGHVAPETAAKVEALANRYKVSKSEAVSILLEEALAQLDR